jgi:hypothetical protein
LFVVYSAVGIIYTKARRFDAIPPRNARSAAVSQSLTLSFSEEPGRGPATPGKCGLFELLKLNAGNG